MGKIILIETSTSLCSAALGIDGHIVADRESREPRAHASMTAPFVKEMLDSQGMKMSDCDAVCVSAGPGSYTGLRVGSSTAKGLCFASGKPLLAVETLEVLAWQAAEEKLLPDGCRFIIPLVDARRMEVYTTVFSAGMQKLDETRPLVVDRDSFSEWLEQGPVLFIGDAADKCSTVISSPNAHFVQACPKASAMLKPAQRELAARNFKDTAYFEPFYLKQFQATTSKKKIF